MSSAAAVSKPLRIGMFGGGTVGGGVYEIVMGRGLNGAKAVISKICVRSLEKKRDFVVDASQTELTTDADSILNDPNIDCIVEVMGGVTLAKRVVLEALKAGKSVVTANKALVASALEELQQATRNGPASAVLAYEAAVCGGIPIVHTLQTAYTGDVINSVQGIANGTTNFMLGKMESGADYDEVLKEAQDLGYAEADPTADVEGLDVQSKLAILAKLAFGQTVPVEKIPCQGISRISSVDFEYAQLLGGTIKLVGTARRLPGKSGSGSASDGPLSVYVSPVLVTSHHLLASARGSGNCVAVDSVNMGLCSYTGPGAGRFPTANSVVADIVRVAQGAVPHPFPLEQTIELDNDYEAKFYIRIPFRDGLGIIRSVGQLAEQHGVSIHSILQNPITDRMQADFCLTTEDCKLSQVEALCTDLEKQDFARDKPLHMPLLME